MLKRWIDSPLKSLAVLGGSAVLSVSLWLTAHATDLPQGLLNYIRQVDPKVQVRFDGLITYSNGESYLPVFPQDATVNPDPIQVIGKEPITAPYPDLVQFDNNLFLLRLIKTGSGKLTLPRLNTYPIQLKEGLLPQDLLLPNNLYIPAELKVILGALPYNPQATPETPAQKPESTKAPAKPGAKTNTGGKIQTPAPKLGSPTAVGFELQKVTAPQAESQQPNVYLADLTTQTLLVMDPSKGTERAKVSLGCIPSSMNPSPDGKLLFATCLNSDQMVVVDTQANLVKTRVNVGSKPGHSLWLPNSEDLLVSNQFSSFLSTVNTNELLPGGRIDLPSPGGVMAYAPALKKVLVADASAAKIYVLDPVTRKVEQTITSLPFISAMWVEPTPEPAGPNDTPKVWVASRTADQVQVLDLTTGKPMNTLSVGKKPTSFAAFENRLFVVSANMAHLDVVDWKQQTLLAPIALEAGSFPSGIVLSPDGKFAYLSGAGAERLFVVNLQENRLERSIPVQGRGVAIALVGPRPKAPATENPTTPPAYSVNNKEMDSPALKPLADAEKPAIEKPPVVDAKTAKEPAAPKSSKLRLWNRKKPATP